MGIIAPFAKGDDAIVDQAKADPEFKKSPKVGDGKGGAGRPSETALRQAGRRSCEKSGGNGGRQE